MEKVKSFLKKNLKTLIMTFTITICSFLFIGKASAEETYQFGGFESIYSKDSPFINLNITETDIKNFLIEQGVDVSIYDGYVFFFNIYNLNFTPILFAFDKDSVEDKSVVYYDLEMIDNKPVMNFYTDYIHYFNFKTTSRDLASSITTIDLLEVSKHSYGSFSYKIYCQPDGSFPLYYMSNSSIYYLDSNEWLPIVIGKENLQENNEVLLFLEQFKSFSKQIYTLIGSIVNTIIQTPLLMMPFGLCILGVIISVFYKLFLRR